MDKDSLRPEVTTVTPTRRLAHWLKARLDEACLQRGLELWPTPDIVSWGELTERMFMLDRQAGRVAGRWLPDNQGASADPTIIRWEPMFPDSRWRRFDPASLNSHGGDSPNPAARGS